MNGRAAAHFRRNEDGRWQFANQIVENQFATVPSCTSPTLPYQLFERGTAPAICLRDDTRKIGIAKISV
jgi:hypothetical protein